MGTISMVASGKDGVGKSTVAVFLGNALAQMGDSVLVVELDSGLRSVDVISGVYSKIIYDIYDVLNGNCEPKKAIVQSPLNDNLYVLSAPFNNGSLPVDRFVRLCTALADTFDQVIIDVAAAPGAIVAAAAVAMRGIVVSTPDPISVRGSKVVVDRLLDQSIQNIRLVLNRVVPERIYRGIVPNLDFCIDNIGARLIGVVPELDEIALACAGIAPLPKNSEAAQVFSNIAERFKGNDVPLLIQ